MSIARFPSEQIPDLPRLEVPIPEGWRIAPAAGALFAIKRDAPAAGFTSNLVVTVNRDSATVTPQELDAATDQYLASLSDLELIDRVTAVLGSRQWRIVEFAHVIDRGDTLVQIVATTVVTSGQFVDVVRVTASVSAEHIEDDLQLVREIVAGTVVHLPGVPVA